MTKVTAFSSIKKSRHFHHRAIGHFRHQQSDISRWRGSDQTERRCTHIVRRPNCIIRSYVSPWKGHDNWGPMEPEAVRASRIGGPCTETCSWNRCRREQNFQGHRQQPRQQITASSFSVKGVLSSIAELATAMRKGCAKRRSIVWRQLDFRDPQSHALQSPASATVQHHPLARYRS